MTSNPELDALRSEIDKDDNQLLAILSHRSGLVDQVSEVKQRTGIAAHQPDRFSSLLGALQLKALELGVDPQLVEEIWTKIHESSLRQQQAHTHSPS